MANEYDIAIIGAGPAGATLARLLGARYRVLLVDSHDRTKPLGAKVCGGLLAPDAQRALASLGLGLPREVLVGPQLFVVRAVDLHHRLTRSYQRHYINVDRRLFDRWLRSLVPAVVDQRIGWRFRSARRDGARWKLMLERCGSREELAVRLVIGADGAGSTVRAKLCPRAARPRRYVAIQEWYQASSVPPHFSAFFDERLTDFYGWMIPKADMVVVGAALPARDKATERFEGFKQAIVESGFELPEPVWREGALIMRPGAQDRLWLGDENVALVGEAACLISPSSAEGISYAFDSAVALADALAGGIAGFSPRYARAARGLLLKIRIKALKAPVIYASPLRRLVMRSGLSSVRVRSD